MLRLLNALAACLVLCASPVFAATVNVSDLNAAYAAVKAAKAGDVVQIAGGTYGALSLYALKPACCVTVQPAPGANVTVSGISADSTANLAVRGFDVAMTPTQQYGVFVGNASNIALDGLTVHQADNTTLAGSGVFIRSSDKITVTDVEAHHLGAGAGLLDSTNVTYSGGQFHDIGTDGILIACTSNSQVTGNSFIDFFPSDGAHPDAIQGFCTTAGGASANDTIKDNIIRRGKGEVIQGIFIESFQNLAITGNAMSGTMFNGIGISTTATADVGNNFVQGWTDDCGGQPCSTRIITRGTSSNVTVHDNVAQSVSQYLDGGAANPGYVEKGNTAPAAAAPGDYTAMNAWLAAKGATVPPPVVTPPPVGTPPTPDPRDAAIASLTAANATLQASLTKAANDNAAQVTTLTAQLASASASASASAAQVKTLQAQVTTLTASAGKATTLQAQLTAANANVAALTKKIAAAQAALK